MSPQRFSEPDGLAPPSPPPFTPPDRSFYVRADATEDSDAYVRAHSAAYREWLPKHDEWYEGLSDAARAAYCAASVQDLHDRPEYHKELQDQIAASSRGRRGSDGRLYGVWYRRDRDGAWRLIGARRPSRLRSLVGLCRRPLARARGMHRRARHIARQHSSSDPGADEPGPSDTASRTRSTGGAR